MKNFKQYLLKEREDLTKVKYIDSLTSDIYEQFKKQVKHKYEYFFPKNSKKEIKEDRMELLRSNKPFFNFKHYSFFNDKLKIIFQPSKKGTTGEFNIKKNDIVIHNDDMYNILNSLLLLAADYNTIGFSKDQYDDTWYEAQSFYFKIEDDENTQWVDSLSHELQHYLDNADYNISKMVYKTKKLQQQLSKDKNLTDEEIKNMVYYNSDYELNAYLIANLKVLDNYLLLHDNIKINNFNDFLKIFEEIFPSFFKYLTQSNKNRILKRLYDYWNKISKQ
jgi:hypothetical protein